MRLTTRQPLTSTTYLVVLALPALLLAQGGCSGGAATDRNDAGGQGAVVGPIGGTDLQVRDSVYTVSEVRGLEFNGPSTNILIADYAAICAKEGSGTGVNGGRSVFIGLASNDSSGVSSAVTAPGTHAIASGAAARAPGTRTAQLSYQRNGADCLRTEHHDASAGQVVVTAADGTAGAVTGTFDVTLADTGEHVTGSFQAGDCAAFDPNRTPATSCP